jgi:hypothetical protein
MSGNQLGPRWAGEETKAGKEAECLTRRKCFKKTSEVRVFDIHIHTHTLEKKDIHIHIYTQVIRC